MQGLPGKGKGDFVGGGRRGTPVVEDERRAIDGAGAGSNGKNLAIHFLTRGWRNIWLRLNGFHRRNDHVPGAIFLKWEAGPWRGYSPTWLVTRAMVTRATSFGTGATMSGKVSLSGTALLVAAKFMPV